MAANKNVTSPAISQATLRRVKWGEGARVEQLVQNEWIQDGHRPYPNNNNNNNNIDFILTILKRPL